MAYRAAVVGGSGYTGAELLRLLAAHPDIDVVHVTADTNAGAKVTDLYPSLAAAYPGLTYGPMDPAAVAGLDVVFLAMPHGASQGFAPHIIDDVAHVVDLGGDAIENARVGQAVGKDDVSLGEQLGSSHREEAGIARTRADEAHVATDGLARARARCGRCFSHRSGEGHGVPFLSLAARGW
jgi:hypothetical protein